MAETDYILLPPGLTRPHRQAIHRYFRGQEMSGADWPLLMQAIDMLRRAEIITGEQRETFATVYDRLVDAVYADGMIAQLLELPDPQREGERLRALISRRILADLCTAGLRRTDLPDSQLLVAFCLYWWQMFIRGYLFEITIYRDLAASGIVYTAHDLRNRRARLSGHDLEVMGFRGDVKTSAYFTLTRRSEALAHDFYITRMYHVHARRWHQAVWLKPAFWKRLDGEPTPVDYGAIWRVLPGAAQIELRRRRFIVVFYDEWKRRVLIRQSDEV